MASSAHASYVRSTSTARAQRALDVTSCASDTDGRDDDGDDGDDDALLAPRRRSRRRTRRHRHPCNGVCAITTTAHDDGGGNGDDGDAAHVPWTARHDEYLERLVAKCQKRIMLHQAATLYYERRHKWVVVPATSIPALSSVAIIAQWQDGVLCGETNWSFLVIGIVTGLGAVFAALLPVLDYNTLAQAHQHSYKEFSKLVKKIMVETSFDYEWRSPVRQFIGDVIDAYDRATDDAPIAPASVMDAVHQRIAAAEQAQWARQYANVPWDAHDTGTFDEEQQQYGGACVPAHTPRSVGDADDNVPPVATVIVDDDEDNDNNDDGHGRRSTVMTPTTATTTTTTTPASAAACAAASAAPPIERIVGATLSASTPSESRSDAYGMPAPIVLGPHAARLDHRHARDRTLARTAPHRPRAVALSCVPLHVQIEIDDTPPASLREYRASNSGGGGGAETPSSSGSSGSSPTSFGTRLARILTRPH